MAYEAKITTFVIIIIDSIELRNIIINDYDTIAFLPIIIKSKLNLFVLFSILRLKIR